MNRPGYVGGQTPFTDRDEYETLEFFVSQILNKAAICTLVLVRGVTAGGVGSPGTVNVQPMVNQVDGLGNATPHGTIYGIPYFRLQGGGNAVIVEPVVGDIGVCVFATNDISSVKANAAPSNPGSARRNSWSDGLYLGGFLNGAPTQYVEFLAGGGISVVSTGAVNVTAPSVTVTGDLTVTGNLIAEGNVILGSASGGTPVRIGSGTALASKVKAT